MSNRKAVFPAVNFSTNAELFRVRVLIACAGSTGDVTYLSDIARKLVSAGCSVKVLCY